MLFGSDWRSVLKRECMLNLLLFRREMHSIDLVRDFDGDFSQYMERINALATRIDVACQLGDKVSGF